MPVAVEETEKVTGALRTPPTSTVRVAWPGATSKGNCALIWSGETKNRGMETMPPPAVTLTETGCESNRLVGRGVAAAKPIPGARLRPKIATIDPGATGAGAGANPPALTTPPEKTTGCGIPEPGVTLRMRWLYQSMKYKLPFASRVKPAGRASWAAEAGPPSPAKPKKPVPA